jgi:hypothetical protein
MSAQTLLDRLDGVRGVGTGRWIARCPAHDDRDPSLSVRELDDGRVLIKCHAGCKAEAVMAAKDLSMSDLFPAGPLYHNAKSVLRFSESRAYHESVVEIAAADLRRGARFGPEDVARVKAAREWLCRNARTEDWK